MHKGLVVLIIVLSIVLLAGGIYVHSVSKGLTEEEPVPYDPGDVFITNLKDGSGLVKVRLMLELKNKRLKTLQSQLQITGFHHIRPPRNHKKMRPSRISRKP